MVFISHPHAPFRAFHKPSLCHQDQAYLKKLIHQWQGRTVGLYGGSFNPAHDGHRHLALTALKALSLDGVWLMVSPGNPLKDGAYQASDSERFKKTEALVKGLPRLHAMMIEQLLGTRRSIDTLRLLQKIMPRTNFVWLMGADNFAIFPHWYGWVDIAARVPIAVFDRPGYSIKGFQGPFVQRFSGARHTMAYLRQKIHQNARNPLQFLPAWAFMRQKRHKASATQIRAAENNAAPIETAPNLPQKTLPSDGLNDKTPRASPHS